MDGGRFDRLIQSFSDRASRRGLVGLVVGAVGLTAGEAVAKRRGRRRQRRQAAIQDAPCGQFCEEQRAAVRDLCLEFGEPNLIAFRCRPQGLADTGQCSFSFACSSGENEPGPANPEACQVFRRSCQASCREVGGKGSIRCSPPEGAAACTCVL